MEYSNGTAEAYRYHGAYAEPTAFGGPTAAANAFCGSNVPLATDTFHLSAHAPPPMVPRRFHPYGEHPQTNGHAGQAGADFGGYAPSHQCDQCGAVYDSPHTLAEHVQTHHFGVYADNYSTAPPAPTNHCHPNQQQHPVAPPPLQPVKTDPSETAEILDLDSHKVHVYQPPGSTGVNVNGPTGLAPTPPYTPATSVGSASNSSSMGWMTPTPPLPPAMVAPPLQQPPQQLPTHDYRPQPQQQQQQQLPSNGTNGGYPGYELMSPVSQNNVVNSNGPPSTMKTSWKASNPPTPNHGGGSEARRPKTYNCEACNKWFTSSGHLKRHYNTTLHKNAVKASNGTNSSGENGRRSTTPSNRSTPGAVASPTGSDEPKMDEMMMNAQPSPKPIPSPVGEYRPQMQHMQQPAPAQPAPVPQSAYPQPYGMAPMQQIAPPPQQSPMDQYRVPFNMAPNGAPPGPYYCPPPGPGVGRPGGPGPGPGPGYPTVSGYPPMQPQQHAVPQQHPHAYPQQNPMAYPPNPIAPPLSSNGQIVPGVGPIASRPLPHSPHHMGQNLMQPVFNNNNMERNVKDDELIKMDMMNGADMSSPSEGSPDGSDMVDGSDASDAESVETKRVKTATPKRGAGGGGGGGTDGVGSFKCQQCDKAFNRVCYLTQHNNTFHKGDKPFKCHMCGKRFQNAELFAQHQQKHAGDKPYKCPLCPKQFNHKTDLRRHMCLHTGQKPFMCQVCSKGFIRKDHMVKHVQTHTRRNALHASNAPPTAPSL